MSKRKSAHSTEAKSPAHIKSAENSDVFKVYMTDLSWQIAVAILGFSLGGWWLDKQYEAKPLFTLVGLGLACGSAALIVRRFIQMNYKQNGGNK